MSLPALASAYAKEADAETSSLGTVPSSEMDSPEPVTVVVPSYVLEVVPEMLGVSVFSAMVKDPVAVPV